MIFSGIYMIIRLIKEDNPNYKDIGMNFLIMGAAETLMWIEFLIFPIIIGGHL